MHTKVRRRWRRELPLCLPPLAASRSNAACMHACMLLLPQKLMVSLAECNFYGALGIVRQAIQNADEPGGSWDG